LANFSGKKADTVSHLFRRRPHNLIEKIEKLGFTYRVDDSEDAEDIAEERAARPKTTAQTVLVYYLDGADTPTESLLALWREETQRNKHLFLCGGDIFGQCICPAGETLSPNDEGKSRDLKKIDYSNPAACRSRCTTDRRRVSRLENEAVLDRMAARLKERPDASRVTTGDIRDAFEDVRATRMAQRHSMLEFIQLRAARRLTLCRKQ
jgi:hypothetical protein